MNTQRRLFSCEGGAVILPAFGGALIGREDGGNLIVNPPRDVWERSELTAAELFSWSCLVAAAGKAMLSALPQLDGGCINYWEAGNWALNFYAPPKGAKEARDHRRVHLHLIGRSINAQNKNWEWGEAPIFPRFAKKLSADFLYQLLTAEETHMIINATRENLAGKYEFDSTRFDPVATCDRCKYPVAVEKGEEKPQCKVCAHGG